MTRSRLGVAKHSMSATITHKLHSPGKENVALTLELYRNGEPWGDEIPVGNPHFRFGKVKAQIILASWDIIEEYIATNGTKPALFEIQERYVSNTPFVNVKVVKQGEFINRGWNPSRKTFPAIQLRRPSLGLWPDQGPSATVIPRHDPVRR